MSLVAVRRASFVLLNKSINKVASGNAYSRPNIFGVNSVASHMFSTDAEKKEKKDARRKSNKLKIEKAKSTLKDMWRKYGMVFIGTHFSIYFSCWAAIFFAMDTNLFNTTMIGLDPTMLVDKVRDWLEQILSVSLHLPDTVKTCPGL